MIPTNPEFVRSVAAAAALAAGRFVTIAGGYSSAGGYALGATLSSAAQVGDLVPVVIDDTAEVEVGAAVALGDPIMSDATGRAVPHTGTNVKVGRALSAASAAGQFIEVLLIRS